MESGLYRLWVRLLTYRDYGGGAASPGHGQESLDVWATSALRAYSESGRVGVDCYARSGARWY